MDHNRRQASRARALEKRRSPFRRQLNEAFIGPDGEFSISKFLAAWAQIAVLAHMNRTWDVLILHWDALALVLVVLIAPELLKKFVALKFGGSAK